MSQPKEIPVFTFKKNSQVNDQKQDKKISDIQQQIKQSQTDIQSTKNSKNNQSNLQQEINKKLQQGESTDNFELSFISSRYNKFINKFKRSQFIDDINNEKNKDSKTPDPQLFNEIKTYVDIIIDFKLNTIKSAFNTLLEQSLKQQMEQYQIFKKQVSATIEQFQNDQYEIIKFFNLKQDFFKQNETDLKNQSNQNRFFSFGQQIIENREQKPSIIEKNSSKNDLEQKHPPTLEKNSSKNDSLQDIQLDEESPSQIKKQDSFKPNIQSQVIERTDKFVKNKAKKRIFARVDSPTEDRHSQKERQSRQLKEGIQIQENPKQLEALLFEVDVEEQQYPNPPQPHKKSLQSVEKRQLSAITEQTEQTQEDQLSLSKQFNPSLYNSQVEQTTYPENQSQMIKTDSPQKRIYQSEKMKPDSLYLSQIENKRYSQIYQSIEQKLNQSIEQNSLQRVKNSVTLARQRDSKEVIYQLSEDGYLVDQFGNYIIDENGNAIQLSQEHIQYLQETNILEQI